MKNTLRQRAANGTGSARLLSTAALWAALVAASPWLAAAIAPNGLSVFLTVLICDFLPSLLLGGLLGRERSCRLLATCCAVGQTVWIPECAVLGDPGLGEFGFLAVVVGLAALGFVGAPLVGGAVAGRSCGRSAAPR